MNTIVLILLNVLNQKYAFADPKLVASMTEKAMLTEIVVVMAGALCTLAFTVCGFIIKKMQKDIEVNKKELDTVKESAHKDLDVVKQLHNEELRTHEDVDRKRLSKVYEKMENEYVKKENLELILTNLTREVKDIKDSVNDSHEKSDAKLTSLAEDMVKLKTQLGA